MKVTCYGHSCFAVNAGGRTLLFDPFITPNEKARAIDINSVAADYILISHGHEDHMADAAVLATRTGATLISNFEISLWFGKQGIAKSVPMNHGGRFQAEFGRVQMVHAIHSSSLPDGTYAGNPCGFVVECTEGNFYYSGDTALTMDMKLIGERTPLRFAALPIGDHFTMGIEDAERAAEFVRCDTVLGLHYDTFPPIQINRKYAVDYFAKTGKKLHLVAPGAVIDL